MVDYVLGSMPTFARKVKSRADLDSLIQKSTPVRSALLRLTRTSRKTDASCFGMQEKPLAVLFTKTKLTTPLYKALSSNFHKSISMYTAHESA